MPYGVEQVYEAPTSIVDKLAALNTGMSIEELTQLVFYIETLKASERHTIIYLRKEETHAPRTIEIDPAHDRIFIHLKTHNVPQIGKGAHKRVTYSILYHPEAPKLVACAIVEDSKTTQREVALLQKFKGSEGIIDPLYISRHTKKSGDVYYEIITPLYNKGSLRSFVTKNRGQIPVEVKLAIAKEILTGSCTLNQKGYVSLDNNKGNFFIHEENGCYRACVGDLGGYTKKVASMLKSRPFGPSVRAAPTDLLTAYHSDTLTANDLYSAHVYSLGRVLYFLFYEEELPWIATFDTRYPHVKNLYHDRFNDEAKVELYALAHEIEQHTAPRRDALMLQTSRTTAEELEFMILQMLSSDPEVRKTNSHWLQYINNLF